MLVDEVNDVRQDRKAVVSASILWPKCMYIRINVLIIFQHVKACTSKILTKLFKPTNHGINKLMEIVSSSFITKLPKVHACELNLVLLTKIT